MKTSKLDINKLLDILNDMKAKGHDHVILELTETDASHVITIHPVTIKKIEGPNTQFNEDIINNM